MVLQSLINKLPKTLQDMRQNFITEDMKNWKVELTAGGKTLVEVKIQRGIFQGDALSLFLFIIAEIPLNHILRKCTGVFKFTKSKEKVNHLMDDIKVFAKNEKGLEINTNNTNNNNL